MCPRHEILWHLLPIDLSYYIYTSINFYICCARKKLMPSASHCAAFNLTGRSEGNRGTERPRDETL